MARTAITPVSLGLNAAAKVTPLSLDATNNMSVAWDRDDLTLVVTETGNSANITITIVSNTGNSADNKVFTITKNTTSVIANLESAKFKQTDGSMYINPSASTGTIYIIKDAV